MSRADEGRRAGGAARHLARYCSPTSAKNFPDRKRADGPDSTRSDLTLAEVKRSGIERFTRRPKASTRRILRTRRHAFSGVDARGGVADDPRADRAPAQKTTGTIPRSRQPTCHRRPGHDISKISAWPLLARYGYGDEGRQMFSSQCFRSLLGQASARELVAGAQPDPAIEGTRKARMAPTTTPCGRPLSSSRSWDR